VLSQHQRPVRLRLDNQHDQSLQNFVVASLRGLWHHPLNFSIFGSQDDGSNQTIAQGASAHGAVGFGGRERQHRLDAADYVLVSRYHASTEYLLTGTD
jgi:hypothetical protein